MKDIINSFKASLYERTTSPLIGAFIFYWLVCNYKMLIVIFDDKIDSSKKFLSINDLYINDFIYGIPLNGLIYPLIATLIYILIFPWISNFIFGIWIYHQNNLKKIGSKRVLTYKEYGELQRKFTELELSFDDTFNKKDNEILQFKSLVEKKDSQIITLQKEMTNLNLDLQQKDELFHKTQNELINSREKESNKDIEIHNLKNEIKQQKDIIEKKNPHNLDEKEIKILQYIGENTDTIVSNIKKDLDIHKVKVENACDKLCNEEYVSTKYDSQYKLNQFTIKEKGRQFLLENNLI